MEVLGTRVRYLKDADLLIFEQTVKGMVGKTLPKPKGSLDGAPVLGYVFPTTCGVGYTLKSVDSKLIQSGNSFYDMKTGFAYNPASPTLPLSPSPNPRGDP